MPKHWISAEQFAEMPFSFGLRRELVRGRVVELPPNGAEHGRMVAALLLKFSPLIWQQQTGLIDAAGGFILQREPDTVRFPDLAYIPRERLVSTRLADEYRTVVPSMIFEVVSEADAQQHIDEICQEWLNFGVLQVWLIDLPQHHLRRCQRDGVQTFAGDELISEEALLPGFTMRVHDLFNA